MEIYFFCVRGDSSIRSSNKPSLAQETGISHANIIDYFHYPLLLKTPS